MLLAILVPLVSYFIVKRSSEHLLEMPRHYLPDSTTISKKNGKPINDTIWHKIPDFSLTNQLGQKVSWKDLSGKIVVVDFFFTHCPTICPALTRSMLRLQDGITNSKKIGDNKQQFLHLLSLSIDPERDSVERLKQWADRFQIDPDQWWLLTGSKKEIYDLAINEMKIGIVDGQGIDTSFIHTDHFVLLDTNRIVRGYYHGLDSTSMSRLSEDIILLTLEKDSTKKGFLPGKLQLMATVFLITMAVVGIFLFIFRKKNKDVSTSLEKK